MLYRQQRNWENLQRAFYAGVGEYGIPQLAPVYKVPDTDWIGFNYVKGCEEPEKHGVHFFIDDYQFVRVWSDPDRYVGRLKQFAAVCTPDFSPYADFPKAVQVFNHYRKHWCGVYWQEHGLTVIPTITWSDPLSLEWCFDGEPIRSVVALSTVGALTTDLYLQWFLDGYAEMMRVLRPLHILWRGPIPDACSQDLGMITPLPVFTERFDQLRREKDVKNGQQAQGAEAPGLS